MKYYHLLIVIFIFFTLLYFFGIREKKTDLVEVCQNRDINRCDISNLDYNNASLPIEERVNDLIKRMTREEKIGQMMLIERKSLKSENDIAAYGLGGLLSGMGSKPPRNTAEAWLAMTKEYDRISRTSRLGIPILYGVDAIHGHANLSSATVFPHFIGLGASHDSDLVKRVALATTEELADSGIYWNFSPNLDILGDKRWGRFFESFGDSPELVAELGTAYLDGIAAYESSSYNPIGTAKHFIGAGAMEWGSSYNKNFEIDQGESNMSLEELHNRHLVPFKAAVEAGVSTVMIGLNSWENQKLSANKYLISDVLKEELGFKGFVVSDWYGVYEIEDNKYKSTVSAINAGIDMVMLPFEYERFMNDMLLALKNGDISEERLDDAVSRILRVKFQIGLFEKIDYYPEFQQDIGSDEHRTLAREAVSKSVVVLKDDEQLIPISPQTKKIYLAGNAADNLGMQLGGWSVEWQGIDGNWTPGTTILDGIKEVISPNTNLIYEKEGNFNKNQGLADIGIMVIGEKPYAEGWGDKEDLILDKKDLAIIEKLKKNAKKIIVIIISGRPLDIKDELNNWDATLAAWLPGSEGTGIADIIFGLQPVTATLPVNWDIN